MPKAQCFSADLLGIDRTVAFATPKNIQSERAWYNAIRVRHNILPSLRDTSWDILTFEPGVRYVKIVLKDDLDRRIQIAVDRDHKFGTI